MLLPQRLRRLDALRSGRTMKVLNCHTIAVLFPDVMTRNALRVDDRFSFDVVECLLYRINEGEALRHVALAILR